MIKTIIFVTFLFFVCGCEIKYESKTDIDPKLYQECMRTTPPAAFDNIGGTQMVINACERASQIRIEE